MLGWWILLVPAASLGALLNQELAVIEDAVRLWLGL